MRFKHIASGMYLQYKARGELESLQQEDLSLGRDFADPATLFNLVPVAVDNIKAYASFNSLARIKHIQTGLYLNVSSALRKSDLDIL